MALVAAVVGLVAAPLAGPAQQVPEAREGQQEQQRQQEPEQERCDLMENRFLRSIVTADGSRITYISGPVLFACRDGTRIRADSVVQFSDQQFRELLGDVEIDGPETRVTADRVHLSTGAGRTQAWGDVRVVEKEADTRMVGDTLVFLEANRFRQEDQLEMWGGRPYAVLRLEGEEAPDTTTDPDDLPDFVVIGAPEPEEPVDTVQEPLPPPPPDTVFGDRLYLEGRTRFRAGGSVRIRRPDLEATGDSLEYDRDLSRAVLVGTDSVPARIDGEEYDMVGRELDLLIQGNRIHRVDARDDARLTGRDVRIEAPRVRVFLSEGEIESLVARRAASEERAEAPDSGKAPRRPEAVAEDFFLRADSIEVQAPGRNLDRVVAVGDARGESLGRDSLNTAATPESIRRDWIEGDTVVAYFLQADSVEREGTGAADGAGARSRLDRLVATGDARSLYRMAPRDTASAAGRDTASASVPGDSLPVVAADTARTARDRAGSDGRLAVHYVVGDRITITLRQGDVERMEVVGRTRGLYLEPRGAPRERAPVPDSVPRQPVLPDGESPGAAAGRGSGP